MQIGTIDIPEVSPREALRELLFQHYLNMLAKDQISEGEVTVIIAKFDAGLCTYDPETRKIVTLH